MAPRYQIFVSSTQIDLKDEREKIINELNRVGYIAVGMEQFPASDDTQMDFIRPIIDESDYYIVIIKGRYGSVDPATGLSYTENEFEYAQEKKKPCLAFIYGDRKSLTGHDGDDDLAKTKKLNEFIERLEAKRIVKYWLDNSDLLMAVKDSVHDITRRKPGLGWVRGDQAIDPKIYQEVEILRKENISLRENSNKI